MLFNVTVDGISERPPSVTPSDPPFFEFFHSFINFNFARSFITIQSCHSSIDITSFHTLWSQKLDNRLLFFFGGFCQWNNHFKRVNYYDYLEDNENPGMFFIVYIRHFSVPPILQLFTFLHICSAGDMSSLTMGAMEFSFIIIECLPN